jgi:hypothetical protein
MRINRKARSMGTAALALSVFAGLACGVDVLIVSGGDPDLNTAMQDALLAQGHSVTIGPTYSEILPDDIGEPDVILLVINSNWGASDMLPDAQAAIQQYVRDGGGLVTGEWLVWRTGEGFLSTIGQMLPIHSTTTYHYNGGVDATTYTVMMPDPVLNEDVADSFDFTADDIAGTETYFVARLNGIVYYDSNYAGGAGVVGRSYCLGRVLSFSTVMGPQELSDPDYARLFSNAMDWAALGSPPCIGDFDCDGSIGQGDLGVLLASYDIDDGGDLDGDGDTDQADLGTLLALYGDPCP